MNINHFKYACTNEFFVKPGDMDYLASRWMYFNEFDGYHWSAAQAIEKYLKAFIVLNNDLQTPTGSHDIGHLLKECSTKTNLIDPNAKFEKPIEFEVDRWYPETYSSFVSRLNHQGSADSRYWLENTIDYAGDIFKIDRIVWILRRLTIGLDWVIGADFTDDNRNRFSGRTYRDVIQSEASFQPRGPIEEQIANRVNKVVYMGDTRKDFLHEWNLYFGRPSQEFRMKVPGRLFSDLPRCKNSFLQQFYDNLKLTDDVLVAECAEWLLKSVIILPKKEHPKIRCEIERIQRIKK